VKTIAIEEHYYSQEYLDYLRSRKDYPRVEVAGDGSEWMSLMPPDFKSFHPTGVQNRLLDVGEARLKDMDENGIDMQVLSLSTPGVEAFDAAEGTAMAIKTNDYLAGIVKKHPDRFAGYAAIAPQDPEAAAVELERAVTELGLKGANINSHIRGEYLDNQKYWPIFEKAEKLGVPIYLHPRHPAPDMVRPYLPYRELAFPLWGFGADTGLHAMCLICSGVFDKYPGLKIILGHLGEALPFWMNRMDEKWKPMKAAELTPEPFARKLNKIPGQYIKDNFMITTSAMYWQPLLQFVHSVIGADRLLFAVDYPYETNQGAVQAVEAMPIDNTDKEKIFHLNAEKLLKL